ncbi:hypothetical protein L2E82_30010 [Cichorium intybus]|uniref:Uncharacterized protein n=1 Tax=Cichorium intybus TaxID=13427 RepID=A0ACB9CZK0_CICIN|nr:hypothetical protein L2E82_30010 [Cichorium intybus]
MYHMAVDVIPGLLCLKDDLKDTLNKNSHESRNFSKKMIQHKSDIWRPLAAIRAFFFSLPKTPKPQPPTSDTHFRH